MLNRNATVKPVMVVGLLTVCSHARHHMTPCMSGRVVCVEKVKIFTVYAFCFPKQHEVKDNTLLEYFKQDYFFCIPLWKPIEDYVRMVMQI